MSTGSRLLRPGRTCWTIAPVTESGVIIDAKAYYRAIHRSIARAQRYVLMTGWQFDADVRLLRGEEAERADAPTTFLELLESVCAARPDLHVYLLAWNYSPVYAMERVWFQKQRFTWHTHEHIHFEWDSWVPKGASHHQKFVVIDGAIAFSGGMDVCNSRWDGRDHRPDNELRVSPHGRPNKPYHDVQAYVQGEAVQELERLFVERWRRNTGVALELPQVENSALSPSELVDEDRFPVRAHEVGLSQTCLPREPCQAAAARQVRALYLDAVARADSLIYIENQYFTSRSLTRALVERLSKKGAPLQVIVVLPKGGDSKKEKIALGDAQTAALGAIKKTAEQNGHSFRLFYPAAVDHNGQLKPTFIHSKLLVVDDRVLSVGSANTTNRSFGLDSELNLTWEADTPEARADICHIRASLLAEHCGVCETDRFVEIHGLTARLDELVRAPSRLQAAELDPIDDDDPLLSLATDPEQPVDAQLIKGRFRRAARTVVARFGRSDSLSDED